MADKARHGAHSRGGRAGKGLEATVFNPSAAVPSPGGRLLFLSVTVYMVYRTVSPEMKIAVPPVAEMRDGRHGLCLGPSSTRGRAVRPVPEAKVPEKQTGRRSPRKDAPTAPAAALPEAPDRDEQTPRIAPPPLPRPLPDKKMPRPACIGKDGGVDLSREVEDHGKEEKAASVPAMRTKAAAPALREEMRVLLG